MDQGFSSYLLPGEHIVWNGTPQQGVRLTGRDAVLVPFSLVWVSVMIFISSSFLRHVPSQAPGAVRFPPLLFLAVFYAFGVFALFGRFLIDAWLRSLTLYALTNRRILIARRSPLSQITVVDLSRPPEIRMTIDGGGRGTIRFGPAAPLFNRNGNMSSWVPALDPTPQLIGVPNVKQVFDHIQSVKAYP